MMHDVWRGKLEDAAITLNRDIAERLGLKIIFQKY